MTICKCGKEIKNDEENSKIKVFRFEFLRELLETYPNGSLATKSGSNFIEKTFETGKETKYEIQYCKSCGRIHVTYQSQNLDCDRYYEPSELKSIHIFNNLKDSDWDKHVVFVKEEYDSFILETKLNKAKESIHKFKFDRVVKVSKNRDVIHLYNYITKKIIVYKLSESSQKLIEEKQTTKERTFVSVVYDDIKAGPYSYALGKFDVEEGDRVIVERGLRFVTATVDSIKNYRKEEEPYPYDKLKEIKGLVYDKNTRRKKVSTLKEDIPSKYRKYFIFPDEIPYTSNSSIDYRKIKDYKYKMFINSNPGSPSFTFELAYMNDFDGLSYNSEYLMLLDSKGYELLHPFFVKFIKDYDVYDFTNFIKPITFEKMKQKMEDKIIELKQKGQKKEALFIESFLWYYGEHNQFYEGSNSLLNVKGF